MLLFLFLVSRHIALLVASLLVARNWSLSWAWSFPTIYIYCIYRVMSKAPTQLSNCLKRAETSVVLIVLDNVLCGVRVYRLISINVVNVSYRRSTWIRYQTTISWSVIKYSKNLSGQCNVSGQIEQVQDKKYINIKKYFRLLKHLIFQLFNYPHYICINLKFVW